MLQRSSRRQVCLAHKLRSSRRVSLDFSTLPAQSSFILFKIDVSCFYSLPISLNGLENAVGQRPLILYGGTIIAFCMLSIGSIYATALHTTSGGLWAIMVLLYVFVITFAPTWAIANRIYAPKIQPVRTRAAAMGLGKVANWAMNWAVAFGTPISLARACAGPYFLADTSTALTVGVLSAQVESGQKAQLKSQSAY